MKGNQHNFLKKFKKLSNINEAAIKPVPQDDVFPIDVMKEVENPTQSDPNAAGQPAAQQPASQEPQAQTPAASAQADANATQAFSNGGMSPEEEMDQKITSGGMETPGAADPMDTPTAMGDPIAAAPVADPEKQEQDIQNELLKIQVSAMRKMSDKMSELESMLAGLSSHVGELRAEVENVREPEPVEKLEKRWQDSYPFKYTLNDLWDGNTFQGRHDLFNDVNSQTLDSNIKKTPDGEYVAPYDALPKMNDAEIKKSFEVY